MMKHILSVVLILVMSFALADQPSELGSRHIPRSGPIEIYDAVYSQAFDLDSILNGFSNYGAGDRWVCDDFILEGNYDIREIYVWMIFHQTYATDMNFVFSVDDSGDSDPNTNTVVWAETVNIVSISQVPGQGQSGPVMEVYCALNADTYPELEAGVHYYFETQALGTSYYNCWILVSHNYIGDYCWIDDGQGVYVRSDVYFDYDSDMFFDFFGEPTSALESETWGSIKTLF